MWLDGETVGVTGWSWSFGYYRRIQELVIKCSRLVSQSKETAGVPCARSSSSSVCCDDSLPSCMFEITKTCPYLSAGSLHVRVPKFFRYIMDFRAQLLIFWFKLESIHVK